MITNKYQIGDQLNKGFEAFNCFMAIKQHFSLDNYDYFKYNGRVKGKIDSFDVRKDKFQFIKLHSFNNYENLILSNILHNQKAWVTDIIDSNVGGKIFSEWEVRIANMENNFVSDLKKLKQDNFKDNFKSYNKQPPFVVKSDMQRQINLETLAILLDITNTKQYMLDNVDDTIIAHGIIKKSFKYIPFLKFDKNVYIDRISTMFNV